MSERITANTVISSQCLGRNEWEGGNNFIWVCVDCVKTKHTHTLTHTLDSIAINNSSLWGLSRSFTEWKSLLRVLWMRKPFPKEHGTAVLLRFRALSLQARGFGHLLGTMSACIPLHDTTRVIFFKPWIKMITKCVAYLFIFGTFYIWFHTESQLALKRSGKGETFLMSKVFCSSSQHGIVDEDEVPNVSGWSQPSWEPSHATIRAGEHDWSCHLSIWRTQGS